MNPVNSDAQATALPAWLQLVREKVENLRFGLVQVVVHEGKVTQIESTERTRLESSSVTTGSRR